MPPVPDIDVESGWVTIDPPPGLLDLDLPDPATPRDGAEG